MPFEDDCRDKPFRADADWQALRGTRNAELSTNHESGRGRESQRVSVDLVRHASNLEAEK